MTERIDRLLTLAKEFLGTFLYEHRDLLGDRQGSCLAILDTDGTNEEVHVFDLGSMPAEKVEEKRGFAKEKVLRLQANPTHSTSFESQNVGASQYGGAIRAGNNLFVSMSGFPAYLDQEFCIFLCLLDNQMSFAQAQALRDRTRSSYPSSVQVRLWV